MLTWAGASAGMKPACPTQGYGVMGSKSREVIYGGIGARIRAEGAQEAAQKAVREADRAAAELWSIQMEAYGGPAQPSPTIAQCLNGDPGRNSVGGPKGGLIQINSAARPLPTMAHGTNTD